MLSLLNCLNYHCCFWYYLVAFGKKNTKECYKWKLPQMVQMPLQSDSDQTNTAMVIAVYPGNATKWPQLVMVILTICNSNPVWWNGRQQMDCHAKVIEILEKLANSIRTDCFKIDSCHGINLNIINIFVYIYVYMYISHYSTFLNNHL